MVETKFPSTRSSISQPLINISEKKIFRIRVFGFSFVECRYSFIFAANELNELICDH